MYRSALALALALALLGCNDGTPKIASTEKAQSTAEKPHACSADAGSPLDVASEPPYRKHALYEAWTDKAGCLVRIDVLFERPGPAHCNQQETRVLGMGMPFGARTTGPDDTQLYVRDPNGLYRNPALVAGFNPMTDLPDSAVDTGYRRGELELWLDPQQPSGVYLKRGRLVERWPRGDVPPCE